MTKYIFPVIHLKGMHLTGQMTGQLKVCPDKMVTSWLDIVHWPAVILSPGFLFLYKVHCTIALSDTCDVIRIKIRGKISCFQRSFQLTINETFWCEIFSFPSICTNSVLIWIVGVIYKTFQGKMRVTSRKLPQTEVCLSV